MYKNAVVIGRFNPMHNGHLALIKKAIESVTGTVHVVLGSASKLPDFKNPLPLEKRRAVVSQVLRNLGSPRDIQIHAMDDVSTDEQWVMNINALVNNLTEYGDPAETAIFSGCKDTEFYEKNFVYPIEAVDVGDVSATLVRTEAFLGRADWSRNVPAESAAAYVEFMKTAEFERLKAERGACATRKAEAELAHAFNNPIEPVVHAAVVQEGKILLVKRRSLRGDGQWALPGGFLEKTESTIEGALRELKEETGVDLENRKAAMLSSAVEENLDDLSVRTLGINYLFAVHPSEELEVSLDDKEAYDFQWADVAEVLAGEIPLFYNHTTVVRRLFSLIPTPEKIENES